VIADETATELGPVAARPEPRTVVIAGAGRFDGWRARVSLDWPAELLEELTSGDVPRMMAAADQVILEHNFPDSTGAHATDLRKVDPVRGVFAVLKQLDVALRSVDPA